MEEDLVQGGAPDRDVLDLDAPVLQGVQDAVRTAIRSVIGAVHAALSAGGYDEEGGPDDEFVFGLDRVLDGVQRLIEARGATSAEREPDA
ncbi:hypothetical protein [Streptomyces sp. NPDC056194]|uniref:hypothetical protein n=1 Tax=unclassified Streptomyces TaxID=2593676 RepID=UPI0035DD9196